MKKRNRIRRRNKPIFDALVWRWNSKNAWYLKAKQQKRAIASGVISTLGAAAFVGITAVSWAETKPLNLPEMEVHGKEDSYKADEPSSLKYTEPLRNVPQTFIAVPEKVFKEQGATSLRDVLRGVAGITFAAGEGGTPPGDNLTIRGFSARTDLFIDGVRDFGGYSRDPFNLATVEVIKGPASNYTGRGSTGGSVNLVSKTPHSERAYSSSLGYGTDNYKRVTLDMNHPVKDGMALRFNAMYHDADTPGRDVATNMRYGFAPSLAIGLGSPTRTTLSYFHLTQDNIPDYGLPWVREENRDPRLANSLNQAPPVDFSNFYGIANRDYEETSTNIITLEVVHDINETMTVRNLSRYGKTDRDHLVVPPRFKSKEDPVTGDSFFDSTIKRETRGRDSEDGILTNQTDLTLRLTTGEVDHTVVTGFEYTYETYDNFNRANVPDDDGPDTDLFNPNPNDVPLSKRGTRANAPKDETRATTIAVYVFDTLKFAERWQVSGGLRWESFDVETTCEKTRGTGSNRFCSADPGETLKLEADDDMLSWRAGLVYELADNGSVYAAVGTSFNPSGETLRLRDSDRSSANFEVPPEENRSYEVGTKWDLFKEKLALTVALFRTEKTNARTDDGDRSNPDVIVLQGEQRVDGLEIGAAGAVTDKWKMFSGYTYMDSEVTKSLDPKQVGIELARTPKHTLSLWTTYELPWNVDVGAGAQFQSKRYSSNRNVDTRRSAPSYWLFDAMASYIVKDNLTLRLNIFNIADEEYISQLGGGHAVPGAGRSATLTADMSF